MNFKFPFFKKKIKTKSSENESELIRGIKNEGENIEEIELSFFEGKKIDKHKGEIKLPPFEIFLEQFYNIILNNKSKQGFGKNEALKKVGEKTKNDMLYMFSNLLIYPMQLKAILKKQKDKRYSIFEDIIIESSLEKTLKIITIVQEYIKTETKYADVVKKPVSSLFSNLYLQGFLLSLGMILSLPYMILDGEMVSAEALLSKRPSWELNMTSLFFGMTYDSFFIKLLFFFQTVIIFGTVAFIILNFSKAIFTQMMERRKRQIDKIIDELKYIYYLKIKITLLYLGEIELPGGEMKKHYMNVKYIHFLMETNNEAYNKGFLSYEYNKEYNKVLTLFLATKSKVLNWNGSEFFYNQLDLILTGYQAWINGTNYNFNLDYIQTKFTEAEKSLQILFNKNHEAIKNTIAMFLMLIVMFLVGIASVYQFKQSNSLSQAMKYDLQQNK